MPLAMLFNFGFTPFMAAVLRGVHDDRLLELIHGVDTFANRAVVLELLWWRLEEVTKP